MKQISKPKQAGNHATQVAVATTRTKARETELEFDNVQRIPVAKEVPVQLFGKTTQFKAIASNDEKEVYNVVSSTYQLIQHRDVYNTVSKLKGFKIIHSRIFKYGRVMMIEVVRESEQRIELIPGRKDYLQPRIRIFNSYDATRALTAQAYGIRLVCKNGAVAPVKIGEHYKTHTHDNINLKELSKFVEASMEAWGASVEILRASAKFEVNTARAIASVGKFPKKYAEEVKKQLKGKKTALLYDVWNAFTNVLTHEMQGKVATSTLLKYQSRVNRIFNLLNRPDIDPLLSDPNPETEGDE